MSSITNLVDLEGSRDVKEALARIRKEKTESKILAEISAWKEHKLGKRSVSVVHPDEVMEALAQGELHISEFVARNEKKMNSGNKEIQWFISNYEWCVQETGVDSIHVNANGDLDPDDPSVLNVINFVDNLKEESPKKKP